MERSASDAMAMPHVERVVPAVLQVREHRSPPGRSWHSKAYALDLATVLKAFFGSNYLSVAFAFRVVGVVPALLLLPTVTCLTGLGIMRLLEVQQHLNATSSRRVTTYGDTVGRVLGPGYKGIVDALVCLTQVFFCASYVIFVARLLHDLAPGRSETAYALLLVPVMSALALIKNVEALRPVSVFGNAALMGGMVVTVTGVFQHVTENGVSPSVAWADVSGIPLFIGMTTSALEGIGCILPIREAVGGPDARFQEILVLSLVFMAAVLGVVGMFGYLAFGTHTADIIVLNLPASDATGAIKFLLAAGIVLTFPIQLYPATRLLSRGLGLDPTVEHMHRDLDDPAAVDGGQAEDATGLVEEELGPREDGGDGDKDEDEDEDVEDAEDTHPLVAPAVSPSEDRRLRAMAMEDDPRRVVLRVGLVVTATGMALVVPSFHTMVGLAGTVGGSLLAFVIPAVAHNKALCAGRGRCTTDYVVNVTLITLGLFMLTFGSAITVFGDGGQA